MNTTAETESWRWVRWLMLGVITLISLVALAWTIENWRGKRAWLEFKKTWEARGEKFELAALRPPAVAPEDNFALTPALAPLLDYHYDPEMRRRIFRDTNAPANWNIRASGGARQDNPPFGDLLTGRQTDLKAWQEYYRQNQNFSLPERVGTPGEDVLAALNKFEGPLRELATASKRPRAIFPVHYEEGFMALLPHLNAVRSYAFLYRLRSLASLDHGAPEAAKEDLLMCFYVGQALREDLVLVSQLVRLAILRDAVNGVW